MNFGRLADALLRGDYGRRKSSGLIARQHKTDSVRRVSSMILSRPAHHQRQLKISPGFPRVELYDARLTLAVERDTRTYRAPIQSDRNDGMYHCIRHENH